MLITSFQIFVIGLGLALAGPCLFSCLPVLLAYTTGSNASLYKRLRDLLVFLSGRFCAYVLLGWLAGLSGFALHDFISRHAAGLLKPVAGVVNILLGCMIIFQKNRNCAHPVAATAASGGLFIAGFSVGVSPCGPLLALLSEIVLISRSVWQGAWYGAAFGLGTFVSAFVVTAAVSGVMYRAGKYAVSPVSRKIIQIVCAAVLVCIGGLLIISA
jgi:sulfite exporter TauE/SafE